MVNPTSGTAAVLVWPRPFSVALLHKQPALFASRHPSILFFCFSFLPLLLPFPSATDPFFHLHINRRSSSMCLELRSRSSMGRLVLLCFRSDRSRTVEAGEERCGRNNSQDCGCFLPPTINRSITSSSF